MKKNIETKEVELSEEAQFEIMSKKIMCKFYRNALFTSLSIIDYEGWIRGQGDKVLMRDHTELLIDRAIPITEERDMSIFKDVVLIDIVTTRIAKELKDKVEAEIIKADCGQAVAHDRVVLAGGEPPPHVHGRLYFVSQIVPMGGFDIKGYGMKFVYGFKIG